MRLSATGEAVSQDRSRSEPCRPLLTAPRRRSHFRRGRHPRTRAILVWRGVTEVVPASARRLGIGSVSSVAECLSVLDEADRVKRGGGRMLDTFRRLLGLGGAAVRDR